MNDWRHNEFQQLGTDYDSVEEVARYDARMRKFRNIDAENQQLVELAELTPGSVALEIGTGTGAWARQAAKICRRVDAIDISAVMLDYAGSMAQRERLDNIRFALSGFLSFDYPAAEYDAVVTSLALHHLSDVWKAIALEKVYRSLKPGGVLVLVDVVFDWKAEAPEAYFDRIMAFAPGSKENFAKHIADELSTLSWIMAGLLERAGFTVEKEDVLHDFLHFYQCRKPMP